MAVSPELSSSVERWRRRYLSREAYLLDETQAKSKSRRALIAAGDNSPDDTVASILINSSQSKLLYCRRKHNRRFLDSSKTLKKLAWPDDELDSLCDSDQLHKQPEPIGDFLGNGKIQSEGIYSEADITLPSTLGVTAYCDYNNDSNAVRDSVSISETQEMNGENMVTPHFNQIYHELSMIHQKLQQEKLSQREYASKLQKRECFIAEREVQLCRHEAALIKIKSVEEEVHTKFQIMKEQHEAEIKQLSNALKEKIKENKRLKASFETLKELNDTLKKQLSDVTEQNKKLEVQSRKVQARLENLQLLLNLPVYNLLTVLMDWISEQHLCKLIVDEDKENIHKLGTLVSSRNYLQEKCVKLLPLVVEQLQWLPFVNPNLHFPMIKCIYWAVRQLDGSTQYAAMTSTMRRLGEDLFKGVVPKESPHNSSEHATDSKPKAASFFKSCSLPLRVVSTLIIIKVVTQADYLAQAFDSLCIDLKTEEGKVLFLDYQAVPIILTHLRISRKGLLSNAIDSLLQMTTESRYLNRFLETCSNELFFRTCSVLLHSSNLDIQLLEKLSILLQKLSKIKSNKKMFELFTLHLMIQELLRTANPNHTFLCINLNSILFNLGLIKNNPIESSENASD
ncbi:coiled-coil domain-containing protein 138 isoform X2 [Erythrolamprus reginae]|uniref:coiled-coil domain-containing protein 138 isoform X2 n=1 Tax=Erythrolamprus reginae TaxID=121349 RepID=UPI00396C4305